MLHCAGDSAMDDSIKLAKEDSADPVDAMIYQSFEPLVDNRYA
eukprot:CAMPEP_0169073372 /NCGR_PEP_ID=MMETSP1015-20121227/6703_1 /TAXON_ID=342587 /ORGANISM="Karlodinium micrum, Strain CCMP2283" /LENGTH=42 /DNA_ID= /DNA_START= /DNA_END= /DNA_ORIENTATION=